MQVLFKETGETSITTRKITICNYTNNASRNNEHVITAKPSYIYTGNVSLGNQNHAFFKLDPF